MPLIQHIKVHLRILVLFAELCIFGCLRAGHICGTIITHLLHICFLRPDVSTFLLYLRIQSRPLLTASLTSPLLLLLNELFKLLVVTHERFLQFTVFLSRYFGDRRLVHALFKVLYLFGRFFDAILQRHHLAACVLRIQFCIYLDASIISVSHATAPYVSTSPSCGHTHLSCPCLPVSTPSPAVPARRLPLHP